MASSNIALRDLVAQSSYAAKALGYVTGDIYFVTSDGNDANDGLSQRHGLATLVQALTLMSAGDAVVLEPGVTETVTSTVSVATANVKIICPVANPESGYVITGAGTLDLVTVSAADCHLEGIVTRHTGATANASCVLATAAADRLVAKTCFFDDSNIVTNFTGAGLEITDDCVGVRAVNCISRGCHRHYLFAISTGKNCIGTAIERCEMWIGEATAFGIYSDPAGTGTNVGGRVTDCRFIECDADGSPATDAWDGSGSGPISLDAATDQWIFEDCVAATDGDYEWSDIIVNAGNVEFVNCQTAKGTDVSTAVSTASSKVTVVSTAVSTADSKAASVGTQVSTADSKVASVGTQVSTADSKVGSVGTVLGTTSTAVSTADSKVSSVGTANSSAISTADSKVASVGILVSTADSKVVVVSTAVSTADSKVASVGTQVSTADSKVASVGTVAGNASTAVSTADSKVASVGTLVSTADSKVVVNSTAISTADSKVVVVSTAVSTADSKVASVGTLVSTADSKVVVNSTAISTADSKVASVGTLVSTADSKVASVGTIAGTINSWGIRTTKAADVALTADDVTDVFTISGPVLIYGIWMHVTTAVSANACTAYFSFDPTVGASATDLCADGTDIISAAQGDVFYIQGASADALVKAANGTAVALGIQDGHGVFLPAGGIDLILQNSNPSTGIADVFVAYLPLSSTSAIT